MVAKYSAYRVQLLLWEQVLSICRQSSDANVKGLLQLARVSSRKANTEMHIMKNDQLILQFSVVTRQSSATCERHAIS